MPNVTITLAFDSHPTPQDKRALNILAPELGSNWVRPNQVEYYGSASAASEFLDWLSRDNWEDLREEEIRVQAADMIFGSWKNFEEQMHSLLKKVVPGPR